MRAIDRWWTRLLDWTDHRSVFLVGLHYDVLIFCAAMAICAVVSALFWLCGF